MENKEIVFIDMDNVIVDFQSGLNRIPDDIKKKYEDDGTGKPHYDDIPGLFSKMDPMPGAIEAIRTLKDKYDLYILSTAPWDNATAWSDKVEWVHKYLEEEMYKRLILSHHKDLCYREGAFMIDDRKKHGVTAFGDRFLHFGKEGKYKDWNAILEFLMNK